MHCLFHRLTQIDRRVRQVVIVFIALAALGGVCAGRVLAAPTIAPTIAPVDQGGVKAADRLLDQGDDLRQQGAYAEALALYEQALPIYRKAGERSGEARCQYRIGLAKEGLRDYAAAIDAYKLSLALWQEIQDREEEAWTLNSIGWNYRLFDNPKTALDYFTRALDIFREIDHRAGQAYALHNSALTQADLGNHTQAILTYEKALDVWRELGERGQEAWALNGIGWAYHELGEDMKALDYFAQSLPIFRDLGDREGQALGWHNSALAREAREEYSEAVECFQQALSFWREIGDRNQEAWALNGLAWNLNQTGDSQTAVDHYASALAIFRDLGNRAGQARVLTNLAWAQYGLGDFTKAIETLNQAVALWRDLGDRRAEADALQDLGVISSDAYRYEESLDAYQQALVIWREIRDREKEAQALSGIGFAHKNRFDYEQAVSYLTEAVDVWQLLGDVGGAATALRDIGAVFAAQADYKGALDYYQRALDKARGSDDREVMAETLNVMGINAMEQADFEKAMTLFQQALDLWRETKNQSYEARALNNLGVVYWNLGDLARSMDYLKQAIALTEVTANRPSEASGDRFRLSIWLSNLADYYHEQGDDGQAINYYQQAFTITQEVRGTRRIYHFHVLDGLALAYAKLKGFPRALNYAQQALTITLELGDLDARAQALNDIGEIHLDQPDYDQARTAFEQSLDLRQQVGAPIGLLQTLANLGRLYERVGDDDQAITYYRRAVDVIESIQSEIKTEELKASFAGKQADIYESLINLLWKQSRYREAFDYMERARARAFLDQMAGGRVDFRAGASSRLLERERDAQIRVGELRRRLTNLRTKTGDQRDPGAIASVEKDLLASEAQYAQLLTELKIQSPEMASLISVDTAPITTVQQLLDPDTTLVEYFVTGERLLAFVVTRDTFDTVSTEVSRTQLAGQISGFRSFASLDDPYPAELKQLYAWLIAPIRDKLKTRRLGIVPHGALHYLPFTALTDGQHYLGDDFVLFDLPSASALRFVAIDAPSNAATLLALGDPDVAESLPPLRHAREEAQAVAGLFGGQALVGSAASESALRANAPQASLVHVAAHGQFNARSPLFSALFLAGDDSQDGRLEAHEVYGLDLTQATRLVVLSACQTQVGEVSAGDEVVSLSRAFLYAGAPGIIASLWSVDDAATGMLMEQFYTHLKAGAGAGEALRQAQRDARARYPHPYHWAAFTLTGDAGPASQALSQDAATGEAGLDATRCLPVGGVVTLAGLAAAGIASRRRHRR